MAVLIAINLWNYTQFQGNRYSVLKLFTGLATAAFTAWKLTVSIAIMQLFVVRGIGMRDHRWPETIARVVDPDHKAFHVVVQRPKIKIFHYTDYFYFPPLRVMIPP
jgi:hypothetical protein